MTFKEQIISTFIGSLFGFVFGICVFYVTEHIKKKESKEDLINNFLDEVEYNIFIIDKWLKEIDIRKKWLSRSDDYKIDYPLPKFSQRVQIFFINKIIEKGFIYEKVDNKDYAHLINFILLKDSNREDRINNMMSELVKRRINHKIVDEGIKYNLGFEIDVEENMLEGVKEVLISTSDTIKSKNKSHIENIKIILEKIRRNIRRFNKK